MEAAGDPMVWLDGKMVRNSTTNVPVLTHSLQYGSGIFEGIRAYETEKGTAIFRLEDHIKRFFSSMKIYSITPAYSEKDLVDAVIGTVRANNLKSCYIRPFAFYNSDAIGISAYKKSVSIYVAAMPFGAYYGEGKEKGIRCKISSWRRINSSIQPVEAKASGNYVNSIIANLEARNSGFDEAILLSATEGRVAEGPADNIFLVEGGVLNTPDRSSDILLGVTRDSVIAMAKDLGIDVVEREIHKEELYSAEEVFFTGTAAEITPIIDIDGIKVGGGKPGPITKKLQAKYTEVVQGKDSSYSRWLTPV